VAGGEYERITVRARTRTVSCERSERAASLELEGTGGVNGVCVGFACEMCIVLVRDERVCMFGLPTVPGLPGLLVMIG
jgi:hypothetical protein